MPGYYTTTNAGTTPSAASFTPMAARSYFKPKGTLKSTEYSDLSHASNRLTDQLHHLTSSYQGLEHILQSYQKVSEIIDQHHENLERLSAETLMGSAQQTQALLKSFQSLKRHLMLDNDPETKDALKEVIKPGLCNRTLLRPKISLKTTACSTISTHHRTTMARGNNLVRVLVFFDLLILATISIA